MGAMPPAPEDELPHAPGRASDWREVWTFAFATPDAQLGGLARYSRRRDHAWYEAALVGEHRPLAVVLDHEVPFRSSAFEVRTTGLWADHVCETPYDHWTVGLEAFALGVDDPAELLGRQHGDQVPLGFDLEWEADGPVLDDPDRDGTRGYGVPCVVHGEVLVGASAIDVDAVGHRRHRWGDDGAAGRWALSGTVEGDHRWVAHGSHRHAEVTVLDGAGRTVWAGTGAAELRRDADDLPVAATIHAPDGELRVEVLVPVPLPVAGRPTLRSAALCRLRAGDGRTGVGWLDDDGSAPDAELAYIDDRMRSSM